MLQFSTEDKTMTTWRNTEADIYMKSWITQKRAVLEGKLVLGLIHLKEITQSSGYHDGFQSNCQLLDLLVFTSDVIVTDLIGARTFWWVQMVHPTAPCQKELEEFLRVLCHHLSGAGWKRGKRSVLMMPADLKLHQWLGAIIVISPLICNSNCSMYVVCTDRCDE